MLDLDPQRPAQRRGDPFPCVRCGGPILAVARYVYCSQECQDADVPGPIVTTKTEGS